MKPVRLPLILSLLVLLGSALPAQAQRDGAGGGRFMRERPAMQERLQQRRDEAAGDNAGERRHRHQLTPEERQQLRRDIHQAGRDIYRHDRPQGRMMRRQP